MVCSPHEGIVAKRTAGVYHSIPGSRLTYIPTDERWLHLACVLALAAAESCDGRSVTA
jgi:hypothetical protein